MSHLEMALGGLTHSTQPPDNCWSSTAWEHQNLTDSGSVEGGGGGGGGGGEYSSSRIDWDIKTSWQWDNLTTVYPGRHGDGGSAAGSQQQQQTSNEWANGACSAVTLATSSMDFSIGLASGGSSASGMSVSSGILGLAASRGSSGADLSSLVKSEPDEINNGMEQHQPQQLTTVLGTPATSSAFEHQHQRTLFISLGGSSDRESEVLERRSEEPKPSEIAQQSNGGGSGSVAGGSGVDSLNMGLKLGRRTYFEDSATGGGPGGGGQVTKGSTPALSPAGKKQRTVSSPSTQIARCQVEGCKADLSSCKDYHRRHKVCEMHSKASRAMAAGIEQRFCQQCSRFHVLTEFDEEKRSCRRRLAGHNQRRRKPHVDAHHHGIGLRSPSPLHSDTSSLGLDGASLYLPESKRLSFLSHNRSFEDDDHYTNSLKHTHPWSLERRDSGGLQSQLQIQSAERQQQQSIFSVSRPATTDRLLMLLQSPKTQMSAPNPSTNSLAMGGGHHHFLERPLGPLGQGLSLSSSTGGVFGSLEQPQPQQQHQQQHRGVVSSCSQSLSSVSGLSTDSGRALSLLSSQSWATCPPPRAPAPPLVAPLDLPPQPANSTLEQLVAGSSEHSNRGPSPFSHHQLQFPPGGPSSTSNHHQQQHQSYEKLFRMQSGGSLNNSMGLNCGNDQIRSTNSNYLAGLGGYEGANSMIALLQAGHEYQSLSSGPASNHHHVRPTIDLMQMPSAHQVPPHNGPHLHAQVPSGQYNEFTSLRPFESSIFSTQQML